MNKIKYVSIPKKNNIGCIICNQENEVYYKKESELKLKSKSGINLIHKTSYLQEVINNYNPYTTRASKI